MDEECPAVDVGERYDGAAGGGDAPSVRVVPWDGSCGGGCAAGACCSWAKWSCQSLDCIGHAGRGCAGGWSGSLARAEGSAAA